MLVHVNSSGSLIAICSIFHKNCPQNKIYYISEMLYLWVIVADVCLSIAESNILPFIGKVAIWSAFHKNCS
jgi:hypothetical protein